LRGDIDIEYFQSLLEQRRDGILSRQDGLREAAGTVELDQARMGRLSRTDALQQQAMARAGTSVRQLSYSGLKLPLCASETGITGTVCNVVRTFWKRD
jgi:DnaK suppressor protein